MTTSGDSYLPLNRGTDTLSSDLAASGALPWPRLFTVLALAFAFLALLLRTAWYLNPRSMWIDEIWLTQNILSRSFHGLTQPLDNNQGAPLAFLFVLKAVTLTLGKSEYALRLFPFIMDCLSVPLYFVLVRKMLGPVAGVVALALFATAEPLVYYAAEVKQYSCDMTISLALVLLALPLVHQRPTRARTIATALVGAVAVWCSHTAPLVIGGTMTVVLLSAWRDKSRPRLVGGLIISAVSGASFVLCYLLFLRQLQTNAFLRQFWTEQGGFLEFPRSAAGIVRDAKTIFRVARDIFSMPTHEIGNLMWALTTAAILAGLWVFAQRAPRRLGFLLGPVIACMVASLLKQYPFAGRLILFLHPLYILLIAAGVGSLCELISVATGNASAARSSPEHPPVPVNGWLTRSWAGNRPLNVAGLIFASLVVIPPLATDIHWAASPPRYHDCRQVLAYLRDHVKPGDSVFITHGAYEAWHYYAPQYSLADTPFIVYEDSPKQPGVFASSAPENIDRLRGRGRVWILHIYPFAITEHISSEDGLRLLCERFGKKLDEFHDELICTFLYDFGSTTPAQPPAKPD